MKRRFYGVNNSDLISRKQVLNILENVFKKYKMAWGIEFGGFGGAVEESIKNISSICDDNLLWNKVELKRKDKNLPACGKIVCWAMEYTTPDGVKYSKFFGTLQEDRYIDTGITRHKLTSNFWWYDIPDPDTK